MTIDIYGKERNPMAKKEKVVEEVERPHTPVSDKLIIRRPPCGVRRVDAALFGFFQYGFHISNEATSYLSEIPICFLFVCITKHILNEIQVNKMFRNIPL